MGKQAKLVAQSRAAMSQAAQASAPPKHVPGVNEPTAERLQRDDWTDVDPRTLPEGSMMARAVDKPRKQASRVERMLANGWIDRTGAAALELYEAKLEASGYGNTKSCLNITGGGGGSKVGASPHETMARDWLAVTEFALKFQVDDEPIQFVRAVLAPYGGERVSDVAERMISGGRQRRMETAADYCGAVADGLIAILQR